MAPAATIENLAVQTVAKTVEKEEKMTPMRAISHGDLLVGM